MSRVRSRHDPGSQGAVLDAARLSALELHADYPAAGDRRAPEGAVGLERFQLYSVRRHGTPIAEEEGMAAAYSMDLRSRATAPCPQTKFRGRVRLAALIAARPDATLMELRDARRPPRG
jgi:hypothetical protein